MRRKPQRVPNACDPERYDDPLGLSEPLPEGAPAYAPAVPAVVTGLSDDEDARRYLALQFNQDLRFCTNCETYHGPHVENLHDWWCHYCGDNLRPVGTKPRTKKVPAR
jgi:hypothetical protein